MFKQIVKEIISSASTNGSVSKTLPPVRFVREFDRDADLVVNEHYQCTHCKTLAIFATKLLSRCCDRVNIM